MKISKIVVLAIVAFVSLPAFAQSKPPAGASSPATSNMEILREKLKADKRLIVAANMDLTDTEAKGFWPVYDAYQKDLAGINERTAKLIYAYANAYNEGSVSDATAKKLLTEFLAIEGAEQKLKPSYAPKLDKSISTMKIVRYFQIENKIRAIIKYELADAIPLVK